MIPFTSLLNPAIKQKLFGIQPNPKEINPYGGGYMGLIRYRLENNLDLKTALPKNQQPVISQWQQMPQWKPIEPMQPVQQWGQQNYNPYWTNLNNQNQFNAKIPQFNWTNK
jgi:hypothetical protein